MTNNPNEFESEEFLALSMKARQFIFAKREYDDMIYLLSEDERVEISHYEHRRDYPEQYDADGNEKNP